MKNRINHPGKYLSLILVLWVISMTMTVPAWTSPEPGQTEKTEDITKDILNGVVITAMKDELDRSMKSLKIEGNDPPYYLEYALWDRRQLHLEAFLGSLTRTDAYRERSLKVGLRVGDYRSDNTGFLDRSSLYGSMRGNYNRTVLEDEYGALRRDLWLITDNTYKRALEQLAGKDAYLKNQVSRENPPDFSPGKPLQKVVPGGDAVYDRREWEERVKRLSAIFRHFPAIHRSSVEMQARVIRKYYINSEGTVTVQPETVAAVLAHASTLASDGSTLKHYVPFYAPTPDGLPGEKIMAAEVERMAGELTALVSAPVLDDYIGPVLFTSRAASQLFLAALVPHLSGRRPPLTEIPHFAQSMTGSKLLSRLSRKVLPRTLTVLDNPTLRHIENTPLIGTYVVDDQGVGAAPVTLVDNGILKNLLMDRRPGKELSLSNGHGRASLMSPAGAQVSNLIISAKKGKGLRKLKKELRKMCKEQELPFGLIIKTLDNPSITGMERESLAGLLRMSQNGAPLTAPVVVVRVDAASGREQIVRAGSFVDFSVVDLKHIAAVGDTPYVHHQMLNAGGTIMGNLVVYEGQRRAGIPASIAAPPVLFEEMELKKDSRRQQKAPLLRHPLLKVEEKE